MVLQARSILVLEDAHGIDHRLALGSHRDGHEHAKTACNHDGNRSTAMSSAFRAGRDARGNPMSTITIHAAGRAVEAEHGGLDMLVSNAGTTDHAHGPSGTASIDAMYRESW